MEGFLCYGERIFEECIAQTFCNVLDDASKSSVKDGLIISIIENLFNLKISGKLRVTPYSAAKVIIALEDLSKYENMNLKGNKKFLQIFFSLFYHFLCKGLFFVLAEEEGASFTSSVLISMFTFLKCYNIVDEKELFDMYCKVEDKGLHNLLVSDQIL